MDRPALLIIGAGGHARSCIDVVDSEGSFRILGLVGQVPESAATDVLGYPVLGGDDALSRLRERAVHALVAVGQITSPRTRIRLHEGLLAMDFTLPTIISPRAHVSRHASIGAGTIVMHGAVVNAGARIGRNCIVNSQALIEHDAVVGDHCHVSTGAIVNGNVSIGAGTFVGSGSVLREGLMIGEECVIGMGQVVRADCPTGARVAGAAR